MFLIRGMADEVGEDGRRSTSTDIGIVLSDPIDGRVQVQFQDLFLFLADVCMCRNL